jgi:DNA helicase-2/ATP-dependent DNA helicase PcrA
MEITKMPKHIILGAPGTGKTTKLLSIIEGKLIQGIHPKDICFCSFSKAAATEAKERAITKFGFSKEEITYFGTIHALCFRKFCFDKKKLSQKELAKFFESIRLDYKLVRNDEDLITNEYSYDEPGNIVLDFYDKLRINFCKTIFEFNSINDLKSNFNSLPMSEERFNDLFSNSFDLYKVLVKYEEFKLENNFVDFIDMLLLAYKSKWVIPTEILIVDEFQDLSPLQYELYKIWSNNKKEVYIAGDDDQTIYRFICANSEFLFDEINNLKDNDEKIILDRTYRLSKNLHKYCKQYIKEHLRGKREYKNVESFKEGGEIIEEYVNNDLSSVLNYIREEKFTYILFRTNYYKKLFLENVLVPNGIIYHEIRGQSIWNERTVNLFNASVKLNNKKNLTYKEVNYLIENIPFKFKLLKRGLKSSFSSLAKKEIYSISDLIELGFQISFFSFIEYEKLYSILDITPELKKAFLSANKVILEYPFKLKIGTIHSAKGKEADDVIIFKDIPNRISKELVNSKLWDDEVRIFYVGMTRAKERLIILRGGFEKADIEVIP